MSQIGLYTPWRVLSEDCVYLIVCEPFSGKNLIKIGYSGSLIQRFQTLLTGIPFKVQAVLFVRCEGKSQAMRTERYLHRALVGKKTAREWIAVNLEDEAERSELLDFLDRGFHKFNGRTYELRALDMEFLRSTVARQAAESKARRNAKQAAMKEEREAMKAKHGESTKEQEEQWNREMLAYLRRQFPASRKRA